MIQNIPTTLCNKTNLSTVKSIQTSIKNNNLKITSAHKGNSMVILNKIDYEYKINNFIEKENSITLLLKQLPLLHKQNTNQIKNTIIG